MLFYYILISFCFNKEKCSLVFYKYQISLIVGSKKILYFRFVLLIAIMMNYINVEENVSNISNNNVSNIFLHNINVFFYKILNATTAELN